MDDDQFLFVGETPPSSEEENDTEGDASQRFMDTVPFEDTVVLDSQICETDARDPALENHLVNEEESLEDTESDLWIEYDKAIVLDSEDEEVDGIKSVLKTGTGCFSHGKAGRLSNGSQMKSWKGQLEKRCDEMLDGTGNRRDSSDGRNSQHLPQCDYRPKTLDYTNSQEPGELCEADALDVVNIVVDSLDLPPECTSEKTVRGKSSPVCNVKGAYNLAKRIWALNDEGKGIFGWVNDNQSDVTAGLSNKMEKTSNLIGISESFGKKSGDCFHNQNCSNTFNGIKKGKKAFGSHTSRDVMQSQVEAKAIPLANAMMNNSTDKSNEELNTKDLNLDDSITAMDTFEMLDVGIGTQIAVEAMEALANIVPTQPIFNSCRKNPNQGGMTQDDILLQPSSMKENTGLQVFKRRQRRKFVQYDEIVRTVSTSSHNRMKKQRSIPNMKPTSTKDGSLLYLEHLHGTNCKRSMKKSSVRGQKKESMNKEQKKSEVRTCKSSLTEAEDINCVPICNKRISHEGKQSTECLQHNSQFTLQRKQQSTHCSDVMDGKTEQGILTYRRKRSNLARDQVRQSNIVKFGVAKTISSNQQVQGSLQEDIVMSCLTSSLWHHPRGLRGKRRPPTIQNKGSRESLNQQIPGSLQQDVIMSCLWNHPQGPRGKRRRNVPSIQNEVVREKAPRDFSEVPGRQISSFVQGKALGSIEKDICGSYRAETVVSTEDYKFPSFKERCYDDPKKACNKRSPKSHLMKELSRLGVHELESDLSWKNMRQKRAMAGVRVLFSQHLDENIIKQQNKILKRLKMSIASSAMDATHFVADKFARTMNMLESIALGKTVVTHLWLESCGRSHSLVDERNYILRDARKEKELGFSMPDSLSRARMQPLLKGKTVFVTPNIQPSKDMITSLVTAVCGKVVDGGLISAMAADNLDNLLILSCKQDHAICQPFLKIGVTVCSSEVILNGIVTQKLELKRHQLFVNEVCGKFCSTPMTTCNDETIPNRLFGKVYSRRRNLNQMT